jgi:hypothetical protein
MEVNNADYSNISSKVIRYINGKHGRIGIIVQERKPTIEEWVDLHSTLAEIAVKSTMKRTKKEGTR